MVRTEYEVDKNLAIDVALRMVKLLKLRMGMIGGVTWFGVMF